MQLHFIQKNKFYVLFFFSELKCNVNEMKNDLMNTRNTKTIYMYFDSYYGKGSFTFFQETICILLKIVSKYLDISLLFNIIDIYFESWHSLS